MTEQSGKSREYRLPVYTVDAFTCNSFEGNPAAVIPLHEDLAESLLQKIASEINLSETAFLYHQDGSGKFAEEDKAVSWTESDRFRIRWFTPTNEVDLCGHATLASAHVLFECLGNKSSKLKFSSRGGELSAERKLDIPGVSPAIMLNFPKNYPEKLSQNQIEEYAEIVKEVTNEGQIKVEEIFLSTSAGKMLVCLDDTTSREQFESINPSMVRLVQQHDGSVFKGVIVTLAGKKDVEQNYDFLSRYFAPWNGIPEDPVTGSAHTVLAPYWSKKLDKLEMKCRQCSRRGGDLIVRLNSEERVEIIGQAKTIIEGFININVKLAKSCER